MKSFSMGIAALLLSAVFLFLTMVFHPTAVSASIYFHGDFTADSNSCIGCHVTHGASYGQLLKWGPTQTDFCLFCHGEGRATSGYDVETGVITGEDNVVRPSDAGGFKKSLDPSRSDTEVFDNTSVHGVERAMSMDHATGEPNISEQIGGDVPGGGGWTGSFKCGSCHDPHAGGHYPSDPYKNPRLLKSKLLDSVDRAVYMYIDPNSRLPLAYGSGFNQWCGGCHAVFNTEGEVHTGSVGYPSQSSVMKFRHKMGGNIPDRNFSTSLKDGLPIATDTDGTQIGIAQWTLDCMTCHRAHGTSVTVSVGFTRFDTYNSVDNYAFGENQSTLLRLPERSACYRCHGAAEYNGYNGN